MFTLSAENYGVSPEEPLPDRRCGSILPPPTAGTGGNHQMKRSDLGLYSGCLTVLFAFVVLTGCNAERTAYEAGKAAAAKGDYHQAVANFTKAIDLNPRDAQAYHSRGLAFLEIGDLGRAIVDENQGY